MRLLPRSIACVLPLVSTLGFNVWASGEDGLPARAKWEMGLALGGQALNDYRGSKASQVRAYPLPFVFYHGDFLKADRNGLRGEFLANHRIELNLSGETSLNGSSEDNRLREGMPELESAFEFGPSLNINLTGENFSEGWQLRLPVRAVISVGDTGIHQRGYTFNPRFTYSKPRVLGDWYWRANVGLLYASERYHDYYYDVDAAYVTEARPFYQSRGGYSGLYFKTGLSQRRGDYWYGFSVRYDNIRDAEFAESPLVETDDYFAVSFFLAWVGWRSQPFER